MTENITVDINPKVDEQSFRNIINRYCIPENNILIEKFVIDFEIRDHNIYIVAKDYHI